MESDLQLVVQIENGSKRLTSIADLICNVCRSSGATSLNITEHDLQPKTQDSNEVSSSFEVIILAIPIEISFVELPTFSAGW